MRKLWSDLNPTLRGFLIIGAIALVVVVLNLYATVTALYLIASIAFPLAIAYFLFLMWRERRSEIDLWSMRQRAAFYGGAVVLVADFLGLVFASPAGLDAVAFVVVLVCGAYAMWRVWRETHTYS
jgi:hypothetical protein